MLRAITGFYGESHIAKEGMDFIQNILKTGLIKLEQRDQILNQLENIRSKIENLLSDTPVIINIFIKHIDLDHQLTLYVSVKNPEKEPFSESQLQKLYEVFGNSYPLIYASL